MTLIRQLRTGILTAFVALLVGIEGLYVWSAKEHLEDQMNAHANETATSLALSIGSRTSSIDASLANIMINPVFDRGHFAKVEVRSTGGELVFGRSLERYESAAPRWFVALVPIEGPTGEALITAGWKQLGKVVVQVHPGFAYQQLYATARATLLWLLLLFALALVAMRYYLVGILTPLKQIEQAALAISNRQFVTIGTEPRTLELQRVTRAINSLSARMRDVIAQESDRAERLRKDAFEDTLTGQLNRRGFEQAVSATLDGRSEIHSGALALFSISGLEEVNRLFGLSKGDELLKRLAAELALPGRRGSAVVGRWQGPVLAAFGPTVDAPAALAWAEGVRNAFAAHLRQEGIGEEVALSAGIVHFGGGGIALAQLGPVAEAALADAAQKGGTAGGVADAVYRSGEPAQGAELKEIEAAIAAGRVTLLGQNVITIADKNVLQMELFCRLTSADGTVIPAERFMPVASRHGLLGALDLKVIEQALLALERIASLPRTVSVNVTIQGAGDARLRAALLELLERKKQVAGRLVFEFTGNAASRAPQFIKTFAAEVHRFGARVALDSFEIDRNSMALAHELLPAYIKLSPAFTQQISTREDLRFIVEAMVRMLRPLEIPLIAQAVEDEEMVALLETLGLLGYQGDAAGRPEPLPG